MSDLAIREQRLTAVLVCERLLAFGMEAELCYAGETIWLQVGHEVTTCIQWPQWWDGGLATREDRAIEVAGRLICEIGRTGLAGNQ